MRYREDPLFDCGEIYSGLSVTCTEGNGLLVPERFGHPGAELEVAEIDDRWPGGDHEYVKVRTANGDKYILRYDRAAAGWEITLFEERSLAMNQRPAGRAPSSGTLRRRSVGS
jgi:hypothetical protein